MTALEDGLLPGVYPLQGEGITGGVRVRVGVDLDIGWVLVAAHLVDVTVDGVSYTGIASMSRPEGEPQWSEALDGIRGADRIGSLAMPLRFRLADAIGAVATQVCTVEVLAAARRRSAELDVAAAQAGLEDARAAVREAEAAVERATARARRWGAAL